MMRSWTRFLLVLAVWLTAGLPVWAQPEGPEGFSSGAPPLVETLGSDRVVRLTGVNVPDGKVVWFNWRLAEEMGVRTPRGNAMSPEFEAELMRNLAWRVVPEGEHAPSGARTVDLYADRYGGWGMGYNKGAGRAAFFGKYNLNIKGVGVTPLVSRNTVYSHAHGGAPLSEGVLEAVWGEVGTNLFNGGSTRILAVIDVADHTVWEDGGRERRALIVRAGHQLRPAHILAEGFSGPRNLETLVDMFRATETLVSTVDGRGRETVDLGESLKRVADLHAKTAAELYRYRILHGGLSPGNKGIDGSMLDLGTVTSQPRTAPVHVLDYTDRGDHVRDDLKFETENTWRVRDLESFRSILTSARGKPGFRFDDVDVGRVYEDAYRRHMETELIEASGLKPEVARALRAADPELARSYAHTLRRLGALTNPVDMNIERGLVERGSVVDVFNALRYLPGSTFAGGDLEAKTWELLAADADDPRTLEKARELSKQLSELHRRVLEGAWAHGREHYADREGFERSVSERAAFENAPLKGLYRKPLADRVKKLIGEYESSGDPTRLRGAMEELIADGRRDVENLLVSGRGEALPDGTLVSGERAVDGVGYGVRSSADGARVIRVELPLEAVEGGHRLATIEGPALTGAALESARYRYTTDGWASEGEVGGRLGEGRDGRPALLFDVAVKPGAIGALEGVFKVGDAWVKNGAGKNFAGYRYAVPDPVDLERLRERLGTRRNGQGFGPRRRGMLGALTGPARLAEAAEVFETVRAASSERAAERAATLPGAERLRVAEAELLIERSADVDARFEPGANRVRITTGLLNALDAAAADLPAAERTAFRSRALGLILGHELAHAGGIKAEGAADREGLEVARRTVGALSEADVRRTLEASKKGTLSLGERLRSLLRYAGRERALRGAARGEADALAAFRRADGTLDWKRYTAERARTEAVGLAQFGMALFLKELATVVATGDRLRIEEFFDGLLTTSFYKEYGLFVLGARAGEVAYVRYLERYIKPRFVNGILKSNLVLAAGLALPRLVDGTFSGKAFAISLGSLGLSSAAVRAGVAGLSWVHELRGAKNASTLARVGASASRLARLGGWFYRAAELAVVLYLAEEIEERVNGFLDRRAATTALADAGEAFVVAVKGEAVDPEALAAAADRYHEAWTAYRDFLYRPLHEDEALFAMRLEKVARSAKLAADRRAAATERLADPRYRSLRSSLERRYGSLEAYAEHLVAKDEAELAAEVAKVSESYTRSRERHLADVYRANRRGTGYLADVSLEEAHPGRGDLFARLARGHEDRALRSALESPSENRLETYGDESAVLDAARSLLVARGHAELAAALDPARARVTNTRRMDASLIDGDGSVTATGARTTTAGSEGASGLLEGAGR